MLKIKEAKSSMKAAEAAREQDGKRDDQIFRMKVALQQFMNANAPLFRAFAHRGTPIDDVLEGSALRDMISDANQLATLTAAKLLMKSPEEVTSHDVRPLRATAAEWVATHMIDGVSLDIQKASDQIADAARLADGSWDSEMFRDDNISDEAGLMISAATVAGALGEIVSVYDFRRGKQEALTTVIRAVINASAMCARGMLPQDAKEADIRNLMQTIARNLTRIMEACYEQKAREIVGKLNGLSDSRKREFYATNDPLAEIEADFRQWATCLSGCAVVAVTSMKNVSPISEASATAHPD